MPCTSGSMSEPGMSRGSLSVRLPPWWAEVAVPSVGNRDFGQAGLCLQAVLKAEKSFLRYGLLRLIFRLPNEMPWREAVNQLKINAKYTQGK